MIHKILKCMYSHVVQLIPASKNRMFPPLLTLISKLVTIYFPAYINKSYYWIPLQFYEQLFLPEEYPNNNILDESLNNTII